MRRARERSGLTQTQLADACKIGRAAINKIESGLSKSMNLGTAIAIQDATGFSAYWLQTGKGPELALNLKDDQVARIASKLDSLPENIRNKIEREIDFFHDLQDKHQ